MKLEVIVPQSRVPDTFPVVTFVHYGAIVFNVAAIEKLPFLQKDAQIAFYQDKEAPYDFFLLPTTKNALRVREYKQTGSTKKTICTQNRALSQQIRAFYNASAGKGFRMRIATEPTEFNGNMYHALMLIR